MHQQCFQSCKHTAPALTEALTSSSTSQHLHAPTEQCARTHTTILKGTQSLQHTCIWEAVTEQVQIHINASCKQGASRGLSVTSLDEKNAALPQHHTCAQCSRCTPPSPTLALAVQWTESVSYLSLQSLQQMSEYTSHQPCWSQGARWHSLLHTARIMPCRLAANQCCCVARTSAVRVLH